MHEEHVTPEDVGKMAAKTGVKAVVMTHLGPTVDPNDDYRRFIDAAKKYCSGPITLAVAVSPPSRTLTVSRNPVLLSLA